MRARIELEHILLDLEAGAFNLLAQETCSILVSAMKRQTIQRTKLALHLLAATDVVDKLALERVDASVQLQRDR